MPLKKPALKPLLQFVEDIARTIHTDISEDKVSAIIKETFAPDLFVDENENPLGFAGFKMFNTDFRKEFRTLEIQDTKSVTFEADSEGLGGVVGFASTFLFEQKIDKQLFTGDTVEIFEVTFFPGNGGKAKGKRLITKAFAAIGAKTAVTSITGSPVGSAKGRLARKSQRSTSDRVSKRSFSTAKEGIKKHSSIRSRK